MGKGFRTKLVKNERWQIEKHTSGGVMKRGEGDKKDSDTTEEFTQLQVKLIKCWKIVF